MSEEHVEEQVLGNTWPLRESLAALALEAETTYSGYVRKTIMLVSKMDQELSMLAVVQSMWML